MESVTGRLQEKGCEVCIINEDCLTTPDSPDILESPDLILTMGRCPETLAWIKRAGVRAVNPPEGVANCVRSRLLLPIFLAFSILKAGTVTSQA